MVESGYSNSLAAIATNSPEEVDCISRKPRRPVSATQKKPSSEIRKGTSYIPPVTYVPRAMAALIVSEEIAYTMLASRMLRYSVRHSPELVRKDHPDTAIT